MRPNRILSAALALSLGVSLTAPGLAAEKDRELDRVARIVKATLAVPDDYTQFTGEPYESPLGTTWHLRWSAEGRELSVNATDEGKVTACNRWEDTESRTVYRDTFGPSFPEMTRAEARGYAQRFLDAVLAEGESAQFTDTGRDSPSATHDYFSGRILLGGVTSPLFFSVTVRLSDGAVTGFARDDQSAYVGALPAPDTSTTAEHAAGLLKSTLGMKLEYVLAETQEGEPKRAVLRYLPLAGDRYYVTAGGELVNLTELQKLLRENYDLGGGTYAANMKSAPAAAEDAAEGSLARLTEVELAGVAQLEGVMDRDALERAVKAWPQLGLDGYAVAGADYTVERDSADREGADVTARVTFSKNTGAGVYRRVVTLDARTGELKSMYSSNPWSENAENAKLTADGAKASAEAFLTALWGDQLAKTEVYDSTGAANSREVFTFTYAQKVNGYFFPGNTISVGVDPMDGSIRSFSKSFDDAVTFDSADGLISTERAVAAWAATYPVEFGYVAVPVALDLREEPILYKALAEAGYSYYNALRPGYAYGERQGWYLGVDAKTGEAVKGVDSAEDPGVAYDDVSGHWAEGLLSELALYNVGWRGGSANPDGALTQRDFLALLLSAEGYRFDDLTKPETADELYRTAVMRGLLDAGARDDGLTLDRAGMVKLLLDAMGYGPVAQLRGIYQTGFTDAESIPDELVGYAALAQGLGLVQGDAAGAFASSRTATRAEAASILWKAMR